MDLSNYVDVPTRFAALLEKWPELRIKEHRPEIVTIGDKTFISVTMQAWRTPDDPLPCQATCFEPYPGKTSFTRDSEQMNASTSCLGRLAGLMMSFPKMASLEEVINRQKDEQSPKPAKAWEASEGQRRLLRALGYAGEVPSARVAFEALVADLKSKKMTEGEAF
jgi:hypothetical protein